MANPLEHLMVDAPLWWVLLITGGCAGIGAFIGLRRGKKEAKEGLVAGAIFGLFL